MAKPAACMTKVAMRLVAATSAAGASMERGSGVGGRRRYCSIGKALSWGANRLAAQV
jgi:hypothetical protein